MLPKPITFEFYIKLLHATHHKLNLLNWFQFSPVQRPMQVVYFSQHLDQFEAPKIWQAAVGWKPGNFFCIKKQNHTTKHQVSCNAGI